MPDRPVLPARFLRASFQPPEPQVSLLVRPRLVAKLDDALRARLLLLIAPAGCGKSTLLCQWAQSLRDRTIQCAWLNIIRDTGPADLLASICWALELSGVDVHDTGLLSATTDDPGDSQECLAVLLSVVAQIDDPVVMIVDDFDRLRAPESLGLLELLVAACPRNLHVVLAGRRRPEFSVSLLHAQGLVTTVLADELIFTGQEAHCVLAQELGPEDAELIVRQSEGWPVAVTLAKLWFRQSGQHPLGLSEFRGSVTDVSAYLVEQVISGMSPRLREFLLDVSVLDQISPGMADAVRARTDSPALLHELLELRPIATVLDAQGPIVRLHPLLTDHLTQILRIRDPQRLAALHEAAAAAYAQHGRLLEAVRHSLEASNPGLACALLVAQAPIRICVMHGSAEVNACLRQLPKEQWARHPRLHICEILLMIRRGEYGRADAEFRTLASEQLDRSTEYLLESFVIDAMLAFCSPSVGERKLAELQAAYNACARKDSWAHFILETLALVVHLRAGRIPAARSRIEVQRAAYDGISTSGSSLHTALHRSHALLAEGRLGEAEATLRKVLRSARSVVGPERSITVIARTFMCAVYYELDRDELSDTELDNLLNNLQRTDAWFDHYVFAYGAAVEIAYRYGGLAAASRRISKARITATQQVLGESFELLLRTLEADLLTREGNLLGAARWLDPAGRSVTEPLTYYERDALSRAMARLALARGHPDEALEMARAWTQRATDEGRPAALCRSQLVAALALQRLGSLDRSRDMLAAALGWASSESAMAPFLEFQGEIRELLEVLGAAHMRVPSPNEGFCASLRMKLAAGPQSRRVYGLLTRRETEILGLLRHSPSNKHIARAAEITEDAVKFHLKNIYRKLGVHSRDEALKALDEARHA